MSITLPDYQYLLNTATRLVGIELALEYLKDVSPTANYFSEWSGLMPSPTRMESPNSETWFHTV